jgi:hypothetical protein
MLDFFKYPFLKVVKTLNELYIKKNEVIFFSVHIFYLRNLVEIFQKRFTMYRVYTDVLPKKLLGLRINIFRFWVKVLG